MSVRQLLGRIRWTALSTLRRRNVRLSVTGPIVSFTFDDFPRSALEVGGDILKRYGVRGTFYAAMGLMDRSTSVGQQFCAKDLVRLLEDGHELGSHTFGHLSCRTSSLRHFEADVLKGKQEVEQITGSGRQHPFSYPFGHATLRAKRRIGVKVSSCRGIAPGVNVPPVDLNLLRANSLYSGSFDLTSIGKLIAENEKRRGWLIFYTHDISDTPSPFGCTPTEFESVVRLSAQRNATILPVGEVVSETPFHLTSQAARQR